jgi:GLTT repeat (6 copies)
MVHPVAASKRESPMLKMFASAIAIAAVAAASCPASAGLQLGNGLSSNGLSSNGLSSNGLSSNGFSTNTTALQPVRLVMPDGTEVSFH